MVLVEEPSVKGCGALAAVAVERTVGPAAERGVNKAFVLRDQARRDARHSNSLRSSSRGHNCSLMQPCADAHPRPADQALCRANPVSPLSAGEFTPTMQVRRLVVYERYPTLFGGRDG